MLRLLAAFSLGLFAGAYLMRRERLTLELLAAGAWDDDSDEALLEEMDESIAEMLESN